MVLKFKNRKENDRKKILIYGLDGTGKSTFAEQYCKDNNLNPVCIDIDDTNFTQVPILDIEFGNDRATYENLKKTIEELGRTDDFDTIIIDGVTSLLEMLTSNARGMAAYSDRSKRWNDLLFKLENTKKNIIFIGQIDLEMMFTEDYQPSKAVIKVNSLVNEKYKCFITKNGAYDVEVKKFRRLEDIEAEAIAEMKNNANVNNLDSSEEIAKSIIDELENKTLTQAKIELSKLLKQGIVNQEECPQILSELERLL